MIRNFKYMIPICIAAALLTGCDRSSLPEAGSHDIFFSARMAGMQTKAAAAGQYLDEDLEELAQFDVTGYDGATRVIDDKTNGFKTAYKTGAYWLFKDNPKAWLDGHTMTFWARANMPDWASVSSTAPSQATFAISSSIPTDVASQWDPLIGYYSGTGSQELKGCATITFYHPLTAVSFKTGTTGEPQYITGINSVTIKGVYAQGSATVTGSSTGLAYDWASTRTGSLNMTGSFNTEKTQSAKPFLLIPQTISDGNVTLAISVALEEGGNKTIDNVALPAGEWQPGVHYIYTLDYNKTIPMEVTVTLTDWEPLLNKNGNDYFEVLFK